MKYSYRVYFYNFDMSYHFVTRMEAEEFAKSKGFDYTIEEI
jgi:hypothetical protein